MIKAGDICKLVGSEGAGKSTLLMHNSRGLDVAAPHDIKAGFSEL